jgi:peptidoglycan LD-endopeptidase CwlK
MSRLLLALFLITTSVAAAEPSDMQRLISAYPQWLTDADKPNAVCWKNGAQMPFDDGVANKTFEDRLSNPCLKDQMAQHYPAGWPMTVPSLNEDPGRIRFEPFFIKMYGGSAGRVRQSLIEVPWAPSGKKVLFNSINGAASALEAAGREIDQLPDAKKYVSNVAGTFAWRTIAGVSRRSMHSFGLAIDFELPKPLYRYWQWDGKNAESCVYPKEILTDDRLGAIVRILEKHGFIWGGKWYHYDTMHFEYRPELLAKE